MTLSGTGQRASQGAPDARAAHDEVSDFVHHLWRYAHADDDSPQQRSKKRAALAALRRGLGKSPSEATETFPYIIPILPARLRGWSEEAYYLIAELFALYRPERGVKPNHNFGATYRQLAEATKSDSTERRFLALLDAPHENLPDHLRHAIGQMATRTPKVPVDWYALLRDLLEWDAPGRYVQRQWEEGRWVQQKWARGFYAFTATASQSISASADDTTNDH